MEENKERNISLPWFGVPKLFPFMKVYRNKIIFMILTGMLCSVIDTLFPLMHSYAIDHFITPGVLNGLGMFAVTYIVMLVTRATANYLTCYFTCQVEMYVGRDMKNACFNHLQELSFSYYNQNNVGYLHARVISDPARLSELVSWGIMDFVWNGSYILAEIIVMFSVNARLALYVVTLVPIAVIIITFFQRKLVVLQRRIREINSKITSDFNEGITGAKTIKTLVVEDKIEQDFRTDTLDMRNTSIKATHYSALFISIITFLSSVALALVLWQGGHMTMEGMMQLGIVSAFMSYALSMMEPIQSMIQTLSSFIAAQVNVERVTRLLNEKSDVADSPEVVEKYGDTFHPKKENWEELEGDIEFRDVTFQYPDGDVNVLEHFNLKVPKGTNVAIVGETGAGKSTLVNLVCRFFEPTQGQVLIDGRDARERSQLWLHSNIGYVLQTPHLFSGSVRENLRYGKPDATDDEIMEALRLVSADGVVERMDKGLDSEVGEGGDLLSTGEKQLLSFARAILADPRILVLDEATSSIDTMTEKAIQDAIQTVIQGRTSFMIAHRLSTVVDADVILVVRDGEIIERGRHRDLMRARGYYYRLFTRQYEGEATDMVS